ncbi:hypothetical protein LINPERHAP1_LOCUS37054 [Linum perenne]
MRSSKFSSIQDGEDDLNVTMDAGKELEDVVLETTKDNDGDRQNPLENNRVVEVESTDEDVGVEHEGNYGSGFSSEADESFQAD